MNRLALLALCVAVACTQAPVREPQPVPIPSGGAQAVPIPADRPQAVPIDPSAQRPSDDLQTYAAVVGRAIRARLVIPPNVPGEASAIYEITLSRSGAVTNLRAVRRSGFPAYDAAIRRAIQRAQPFPQPATADPAKPTRLQLTFKVKE